MTHFIVVGHFASHVQRYIHQPSLYRHRNIRFPWYTAKWPFCTISIRTRFFISERCSKWAILRHFGGKMGQNGAKMAPPFPNEQALSQAATAMYRRPTTGPPTPRCQLAV